jgi:hypothetical protein
VADEVQTDAASDVKEDITGGLSFSGEVPAADPMRRADPNPRPDNVPEKFWDAEKGALNTEALLKSYTELEKQFSSKGDEKPEDKPADAPEDKPEDKPEDVPEDKPEDEDKPADKADLTSALENANKVFQETGGLDADARKPFLDAGYTDEHIDLYLAGVKAQTEGLKQAAIKGAGVEDYAEVEKAIAWASENWSEKKILAFNAQAADVETIGDAAKMLYQAFSEANPGEGRLAAVSGHTRGDVYTNKDQYQVDLRKADSMADPLEAREARKQAVDKMRRSITAKSIKN